jgi:hypothetical protein
MDADQVDKLKTKNCEAKFPCNAVMPGKDATDADRAIYYKLPCHEERAKCYESEIEELNELMLKTYNEKLTNMAIGFGVGMGLFILIMVILIVVFTRRILADRKKKKALAVAAKK